MVSDRFETVIEFSNAISGKQGLEHLENRH